MSCLAGNRNANVRVRARLFVCASRWQFYFPFNYHVIGRHESRAVAIDTIPGVTTRNGTGNRTKYDRTPNMGHGGNIVIYRCVVDYVACRNATHKIVIDLTERIIAIERAQCDRNHKSTFPPLLSLSRCAPDAQKVMPACIVCRKRVFDHRHAMCSTCSCFCVVCVCCAAMLRLGFDSECT